MTLLFRACLASLSALVINAAVALPALAQGPTPGSPPPASPVPEPSDLALMGAGLAVLAIAVRRGRNKREK